MVLRKKKEKKKKIGRRGKEEEEDEGRRKRKTEEANGQWKNVLVRDDAGPTPWCLGAHFCPCVEKKLKASGEPAARAQSFQLSS